MKCGDRIFGDLRSSNIRPPKPATLPKFSTAPRSINAVRLSTRGPADFWRWAKEDRKNADERRSGGLRVATLYKRKADKVRPVDADATDGQVPGGRDDWQDRAWRRLRVVAQKNDDTISKYHGILVPRTTEMPVGTRLTEERAAALVVGDDVRPAERELLIQCLMNREAALAWSFAEMGRVQEEVAPPQKIRTVPHTAWQAASFPIPRAIRPKIAAKVQERIDAGVYERCEGPYRNPWFCVKKKDGDLRIVNAAMEINRRTIRDANLPPSADEFSEHIAGMAVSSLIDWFSGYDQIPLDVASRDLTAFFTTTHGLLRQTTLPQGATNSVGQFVRIGLRILERVPARPYIDDIAVDGPKTDYGQAECAELPGVRRYMLEHIMNLDKTLLAIECAEATVSGKKSQWLMSGLKIVGYVCDANGRHPELAKIEKVVNWKEPSDASEVKGFLGLCVYYRIWIKDFAVIAGPMYRLTKKNAVFSWSDECKEAMAVLQEKLTTAPALVTLDFADDAGKIVLVVDASPSGWGAVLMQERRAPNGKWKRHPSRYESGLWSDAESKYDQLKRECRGLLKALKKFRFWLYGVHFYVETDANTLCAQLNRSATDLPGALVTQWIAWIRLFDFEIKHIDGKKNQAADALSRRRPTEDDLQEREDEEDIDDWIDAQLSALRVCPVRIDEGADEDYEGGRVLLEEYSDEYEHIAVFLTNGMKKSPGHTAAQHKAFRSNALKFIVRDGHIFRREDARDLVPRKVICDVTKQQEVIKSLHDDSGHRGREGTHQRVRDRYFWEGLYNDVRKYCESCEECQKRQGLRQYEELTPTFTDHCWEKIGVDIVHMPKDRNKNYLVLARSDLSGWVEGRALSSATSELVAQFLYEDIICRHGLFRKMVVDGGPENKDMTEALANRYNIRRVVTSAYHPQANGLVERGHAPVVNALSKMTGGGLVGWVRHLPTVLWADRTTVKRSTGLTPYEVEYAQRPVLPIELDIPTWAVMNWEKVTTTADLIAVRARMLERRDEDIAEVAAYLRRMREANKDDFDARHRTRKDRLEKGQMVLLRNKKTEVDMSRSQKLLFRWLGPYVVKDVVQDRGTYLLAEIGDDGAQLKGTFAGERLRPFRQRSVHENVAVESAVSNHENVGPTLPLTDSDQSEGENEEGLNSNSTRGPSTRETRGRTATNQEVVSRRREGRAGDFEQESAAEGAAMGEIRRISTPEQQRPRIIVNVPPLPQNHQEFEPLLVRGRGRPRKLLRVVKETEE